MALSEYAQKKLSKTKKVLRRFLQDTPELNRLIRKEEISDEDYEICIELAIGDWNATSPMIGATTLETFPSLYLLVLGSAVQALRMAGIYQSRNELNYSALGSSFTRANKTQYYIMWLNEFRNDYERKKKDIKITQNVNLGFGGTFSEYQLIGYDF